MLVSLDSRNNRQRFNEQSRYTGRRGMKSTHKSLITWHIVAAIYYFYTSFYCSAEQMMTKGAYKDLSYTFDEDTIYWVYAKKLDMAVIHNGTDSTGSYWYQTEEISAGTHGGTHMDSPCHFSLGAWCISDIPLDRLVVPAVVVDISQHVGNDSDVHLTTEHIMAWENNHGHIPDKSLLLVRTGWARFWPDPLTYSGTTEKDRDLLKFPSIEPEAAKWLTNYRDIVGLGIDVMSADIPNKTLQTHLTLANKNIYILENLNLSEELPPTGLKAYSMPMKLKGASGAPCRVLVELVDGDATSGNVGTGNSVILTWTNAGLLAVILWTLS